MQKAIIIWITFFISACASTTKYDENFSSIMIASDHSKVVVLGEKYDYIFDTPKKLDESLNSDFKQHLYAKFTPEFHVTKGGKIWGFFSLVLNEQATEEEKTQAIKLGYNTSKDGLIFYGNEISGIRYTSNRKTDYGTKTNLNQSYRVHIIDSQSNDEQAQMASPIIVLTGGAIAIANPALLLTAFIGLRP